VFNSFLKMKRVRFEDFRIQGRLGQGNYGEVISVEYNGQAFALKMLNAARKEEVLDYQDYCREVFGLSQAGHLKAILATNNQIGLLMPKFGKRLGQLKCDKYSLADTSAILWPIAQSLAKSTGMHRDIKPSNILFPYAADQTTALVDFSLSTNMRHSCDRSVVTLWYRAPEIIVGLEYSSAVDVWSFGLVILNLLTGSHFCRSAMDESNKIMFLLDIFDSFGWPRDWPEVYAFLENKLGSSSWHNCNEVGTYDFAVAVSQAKSGPVARRPNAAEVDITVDLLKKCLRTKPSERLTWPEILAHPFWTLKSAGHVPSIPSAPTVLSDIDFEDIQNFLDKSCKVEAASTATLVLPKGFSIRTLLFAMDHLLHYGKKAAFSQDTALKAYYIWRHAIQNGLKHNIYGLSAALFLAGSYNEDFRIKNFTWITWSALWDESKCLPKFSEAVLDCLKACKGQWPTQSFEALQQSIYDIVGPSIEPWSFPFLAACDDLEDLEDFAVEMQELVLHNQIATVPVK